MTDLGDLFQKAISFKLGLVGYMAPVATVDTGTISEKTIAEEVIEAQNVNFGVNLTAITNVGLDVIGVNGIVSAIKLSTDTLGSKPTLTEIGNWITNNLKVNTDLIPALPSLSAILAGVGTPVASAVIDAINLDVGNVWSSGFTALMINVQAKGFGNLAIQPVVKSVLDNLADPTNDNYWKVLLVRLLRLMILTKSYGMRTKLLKEGEST